MDAAMAVLMDALARCRNEDMRTAEVTAALDFLAARADQQWPFNQFWKALDSDNEEGRWQNPRSLFERHQAGHRRQPKMINEKASYRTNDGLL